MGKAKQHVSCNENLKLKICEGHKQVVAFDSRFQLSLADPKTLVGYEGGFALPLGAPVLFTMLNYQGPVSQAQLDANVFAENKGLSLDIPFLLTLKDTEHPLSINTVGAAAWCEAQFWVVIDKE